MQGHDQATPGPDQPATHPRREFLRNVLGAGLGLLLGGTAVTACTSRRDTAPAPATSGDTPKPSGDTLTPTAEAERDISPIIEPVPAHILEVFDKVSRADVSSVRATAAEMADKFQLLVRTHERSDLTIGEIARLVNERSEAVATARSALNRPKLPGKFSDLVKDAMGAKKVPLKTYMAAAAEFFGENNYGKGNAKKVLFDWDTSDLTPVELGAIAPNATPAQDNACIRKTIVDTMQMFANHDKQIIQQTEIVFGELDPSVNGEAISQIDILSGRPVVILIIDTSKSPVDMKYLMNHEISHGWLVFDGPTMTRRASDRAEYYDPAVEKLIPQGFVFSLNSLLSIADTGSTGGGRFSVLSKYPKKGQVIGAVPEAAEDKWDWRASTDATLLSGEFSEMLYKQAPTVDTEPAVMMAALSLARLRHYSKTTATYVESLIVADRTAAYIRSRLKKETSASTPNASNIAQLQSLLTQISTAKKAI